MYPFLLVGVLHLKIPYFPIAVCDVRHIYEKYFFDGSANRMPIKLRHSSSPFLPIRRGTGGGDIRYSFIRMGFSKPIKNSLPPLRPRQRGTNAPCAPGGYVDGSSGADPSINKFKIYNLRLNKKALLQKCSLQKHFRQ